MYNDTIPPSKEFFMKQTHIFGGGTFSHVRNHMALAAPAFGNTARFLAEQMKTGIFEPILHLTKMADHSSSLVTNEDVSKKLDELIADENCKIIFFNVALCDYHGEIGGETSGKYQTRLKTVDGQQLMTLTPAEKLIGKIRKERKDIFVVGFKTTCGATSDEQYITALNMLKANSINLVLANDTKTRNNMIVAPEETRYFETTNRNRALQCLVQMVHYRSQNTFTRSTVIDSESVSWEDPMIPDNLRQVVNHCIERGAYKPFRGVTVGHFAARIDDKSCLTSKRKHNFNKLSEDGLVKVDYDGLDKVIAHGAKPSVGGQSQRIIFQEHADADAIVHFHCPMKENPRDLVSVDTEQWMRECGSHQCGQATSRGLAEIFGIKAVMLSNHGPNIVFSKNTPAEKVIDFIEANFELEAKTGGLV